MKYRLKERRESVKDILLNQLELGTKPVKRKPNERVPMTQQDIKRVQREIQILSGEITKYKKKNRKHKGGQEK